MGAIDARVHRKPRTPQDARLCSATTSSSGTGRTCATTAARVTMTAARPCVRTPNWCARRSWSRRFSIYVFGDLFAPHRLAHLTRAVDAAIREGTRRSTEDLTRREAELREARRRLDNIADAIAEGIRTPTTLARLQEAERQVAACEGAVREAKQHRAPVVVVKTSINCYLADLRATLATDIDEARRLLARGFGRILLRRDEDGRLWADVHGNLAGLLDLDEGADGLLELVPEERLPSFPRVVCQVA